jgi:hypothetical protein
MAGQPIRRTNFWVKTLPCILLWAGDGGPNYAIYLLESIVEVSVHRAGHWEQF